MEEKKITVEELEKNLNSLATSIIKLQEIVSNMQNQMLSLVSDMDDMQKLIDEVDKASVERDLLSAKAVIKLSEKIDKTKEGES